MLSGLVGSYCKLYFLLLFVCFTCMQCIGAAYCYRCCMWCVCVCSIRVSCTKTAELIKMPFRGLTRGSKEPCIRWCWDLPREGAILRGRVPSQCNVRTHECIAHCLPAATGECAYPAHTAGECICHHYHEG